MKIICDTCERVFEVKEAVTPGATFYCSESCLETAFEEHEGEDPIVIMEQGVEILL